MQDQQQFEQLILQYNHLKNGAEEIRRMIFLHPETYTDYSLDDWNGYFFSDRPVGYHQGKHMDFAIVVPHSYQAESGQWKQSKLEDVKKYLISLL